jgi:hypothetical protein
MGLNITTEGVPVEAACLSDLGIDADRLAHEVLSGFAGEIDGAMEAARKVRPVL